jgi:hypothetical protein
MGVKLPVPETSPGQQRIDYKTYDLMKNTVFAFQALPNDDVTDITIVAVPAD